MIEMGSTMWSASDAYKIQPSRGCLVVLGVALASAMFISELTWHAWLQGEAQGEDASVSKVVNMFDVLGTDD